MLGRWWVAVAALGAAVGVASASNVVHAGSLKLGTLAPERSPWGTVFKAWAKVAKDKGTEIEWVWNGGAQTGDENAMVSQMSSGQLDGAAITAAGLGQIYPTILAFQMPGAFSGWDKLDATRNALKPTLDAAFAANKYKILGYGDVGEAHILSIGFPVRTPSDLTKGNTYTLPGDPIAPALFSAIGGVNYKPLSVGEILGNIGSSVQILNAPSLAAEQLQWSARVTHITTMTTGYGIGALVMWQQKFDSLDADVKQMLTETGANAARSLTNRIRNLDAQSFARLKQSKTAVELNDSEKAEWNAKFAATRASLRGRPFDGAVFDQIARLGH